MIVMKFGGTSVGSAEAINKVVDIVLKEKAKKVVVVSAMAGVTDKLTNVAHKVRDLPPAVVEQECNRFYNSIIEQHKLAAAGTIKDKAVLHRVVKRIEELCEELRITLMGVGFLGDLSPKSLDYVLSFGERLSVAIVAGSLEARGIKAKDLSGHEAGIITDSNFGCARPLYSRMKNSVKNALTPLLDEDIVPVVTGFIAADESGHITTLGRGGSDYTASLLGRFLDVDEVQIWTDVDGILSTDPKVVTSAQLIKKISYIEAMDLAYFGAKVIHSKMIEPAMDANIPVRIKNTFNPDCEGTLIISEREKIDRIIKAVAISKDVDILNLRGVGMAETPNITGRVFNLLGEKNISIPMISGSSESNLSFVVKRSDVQKAIKLIDENFVGNGIRSLDVMEGVCIISVVGVGMAGTKGIAAKIFQTVSENDVNIIMIAQGSSEVTISFVVKVEDGDKVVRALHKRFIDDETKSS